MREKEIKEGLGDLAHRAEMDHEVQMARADLYKIAKYAIKLHDMLKGISEAEGLEGWVQSKITKSAEMIGSVYHHLDYQEAEAGMDMPDVTDLPKKDEAKESKTTDYKANLRAKLAERTLTKGETKKKEKFVKGMKKAKGDFKDRYGKDAEAVMYATATKMAKE